MNITSSKNFFVLIYIMISISSYAQSDFQKFKRLSRPKKTWVFFHVFKAKKALAISKEANRVADSINKTTNLDNDPSGGQVDAFRHAYWMARLHQEIGKSAARSLGKKHEKENYLMFKSYQLEEGVRPDACSKRMDLFNNEVGLTLTRKNDIVSSKNLTRKTIEAIKQVRMKVIKKNKAGQFLTTDNKIIDPQSLKGKWENNKCLVRSNYIRK